MALEQGLADHDAGFAATAPPGAAEFLNAKVEELTVAFPFDRVLRSGDLVPEFSLPDITGEAISLLETLASGPVVLAFYCGAWCPYCDFQLAAYERAFPAFAEAGGRLIAISPQEPGGSLLMTERNSLTFDVLSDAGNAVARQFGLVFKLPDDLKAAYASSGFDLAVVNGDNSWELPIPATFVIGNNGRVQLVHAEIDCRKRLAPGTIIEALQSSWAD